VKQTTPLTSTEEAFFRSLSHLLVALSKAFDADLMREHGMSMSEYTTLMHLSEAPAHSMRMSDLAAAANLSLSGMTRTVQRLENQDRVQRKKSASDGRTWHATLTPEGLRALQNAWPTHLASARRHVFDHLAGVDLEMITQAFDRVANEKRSPTA
jgi:DNA-binding MarR family transcriptional regulator